MFKTFITIILYKHRNMAPWTTVRQAANLFCVTHRMCLCSPAILCISLGLPIYTQENLALQLQRLPYAEVSTTTTILIGIQRYK